MNTTEHNKPGISSQFWSITSGVIFVVFIFAFWPIRGHGQSVEAEFAKIEGAFGLKLGETFDVAKGKVMPSGILASTALMMLDLSPPIRFIAYEFTAQNPLPEFNKYLVGITPKTHRICLIEAIGPPLRTIGGDRFNVISAALAKKYGGKPDSRSGAYSYSRKVKGRSIEFLSAVDPDVDNWGVGILYMDDGLLKTAWIEHEELHKAEQDSKQREVDAKAKGLEKSGL